MIVTVSMPFARYSNDHRFRGRSDNIYPPGANGELRAVTRRVHDSDDHHRRDWRGRNVLVG